MPFDEANKGDPFRGDFPGTPGRGPWGDLQTIVQRQADELTRLRYEPAIRRKYLTLLQERRRPGRRPGPPEPGTGATREGTVTQFEFLPADVGFDTLLVPGELLITRESYDGRPRPDHGRGPEHAKDILGDLQLEASELDCDELQNRILRLTPTREMGPQELADTASLLRARGFAVSLTNITPTAPVHKPPPVPIPPGTGTLAMRVAGDAAKRQAAAAARPLKADGPGEPAQVAVIDSGIAAEIRADGWLGNVPRDGNVDLLDVFPLPAGDGYLDFEAGHGTFVAGIVQQVSPEADITVRKAGDTDGIFSEVTVACEMIRAVKEGAAQIVNLSLGCETQDNVPPIAIRAALDIIGEWERETGREVLIVAAAGNFADNTTPCWPAAFRRVVSVAGLAPDMRPAQWSTRGSWVTCSTIGQGVSSTYVEGRESPVVDPQAQDFGPDSWAVWSGTSFAAPQITGALARLHQENGYPLREALRRLLAAGQPIPEFGQALKILPGV
jgi:Subtilase family